MQRRTLAWLLMLVCPPVGWAQTPADAQENLAHDGGFEKVVDVPVGNTPHIHAAIRAGTDFGSKGPVVELPAAFGGGCGLKRLHVVTGEPGKDVHSGKRAIRLTGSFYVRLDRRLDDVKPGTVFRATLYARGEGTVRLIGSVRDKTRHQCAQIVPRPVRVPADRWLRVEHTYDTSSHQDMTGIGFRLEASGDVWIDDLVVTRVRKARATASTVNTIAFAVPTDKPVTIDGKLDEPCWRAGMRYGPFWKIYQQQTACEPRTLFQVAYDGHHVYVAIEAAEPVAKKAVGEKTPRGAWVRPPSIEFFLDTNLDRSTYYQLAASTGGGIYDSRGSDAKWDLDWKVASRIGHKRWTLEAAIPFADLAGGVPQPGMIWGLNVCRNRPGAMTLASTWARVGSRFHSPGRFNTLVFGTVADWWSRQQRLLGTAQADLRKRLAGLSPRDALLERKLETAARRAGMLTPPGDGLTGRSPQFLDLYEQVASVREDFHAVAQESEAVLAVRRARAATKP